MLNDIECSAFFFIVLNETYILCKNLIDLCPLFADPTANLVTPGPYGLIFASFVPFFFDIPVSTRFRVFSFFFSDKSFIYLAGIQVLLN